MAELPLPPSEAPPQFPGDPEKSPIPPNSPPNRPRGRPAARTLLRNRRYAALRELLREGHYFSDSQMRLRAPALFHHYIGRFQTPQIPQNRPKIPQNHPQIPQNRPKIPQNRPKIPPNHPQIPPNHPQIPQNCPQIPQNRPQILLGEPQNRPERPQNLRELLLSALEETPAAAADDDEDEEEEEDDEDEDEGHIPDAAERELLRLEFTTRMHQRFLEGLDEDFDYSQVDGQAELDALELLEQDLQDRYFDEEEPGPAPPLA